MILSGYLQYMQQVLGVNQVFLSPPVLPLISITQVLFVDKTPWSGAARELFIKMREAMRLSDDEIEIVFSNELASADIQLRCLQARQIVCFDRDLFPSLQEHFTSQVTQTWGPEALLKDAAKKKTTWADLQAVMKRLS